MSRVSMIPVSSVLVLSLLAFAVAFAAPSKSNVQLNLDSTGPREVEDQTARAVVRDYGAAWQNMGRALEQNNPSALGDVWTGFARDGMLSAIEWQKSSGLKVRYVDNGHKLEGVFYSPEGSALELHDTAQLERQVLDGSSVVQSEQLTAHYVVVMTPAADRWQVRVFQSVPNF